MARGKRIAFGDGTRIIWDQHCAPIFAGNPNVAPPGSEGAADIEWIAHHKGNRQYNSQDGARWRWNLGFKATPGEMFFSETERKLGKRHGKGFVLIECAVPTWKSSAANKDWGHEKYQIVASTLRLQGHRVVQFGYGSEVRLAGVEIVSTRSFRDALAILRVARLYIGPEGGLHHGAAAVGVPGVVLFGGFIPPAVTGYDMHSNLTGGAEACGSLRPCQHCRDAMAAISVHEVIDAARNQLTKGAL